MKYIIRTNIILLLLLATACSEEFLKIEPIAIAYEDTYYRDSAALDQTVIAAYAQLCARDIWDIHYSLAFGSAPGDDAETGGESTTDWPEIQNFDRFEHTKNDAKNTEEFYRYCYKGIRLCNTVLNKIPIVKEYTPTTSDYFLNKSAAEVIFLRAFYHFSLVQVFGGVIIVDKNIYPADFALPKNTIKEVFAFCEKDLKEAIPNLPRKNEVSEIGRVSRGAAEALLARLLMYESGYAENYPGDSRFEGCQVRYKEAFDYAKSVIDDNTNYSLVGVNGERYDSWWGTPSGLKYLPSNPGQLQVGGFRWLFTVDGDNSSETVFEIQSVRDGKGWGYTRGNALTVYQTVRKYSYIDNNGVLIETDAGGWSFNLPSQYLIKAFQNNDSRESGLNSTPGNENDDPRFNVTIGQPGDTVRVGKKWEKMSFSNLPTNTIGRKFECSIEEYNPNSWSEGPFNIRLIRLADVMLLASEAAFKLGDQQTALELVNQIRTRARMSGDTNKPEDLSAVSFEDIVHERRLELPMEPHRFFDLVRWGLTDKYLNGINLEAVGPEYKVAFEKGKHEFWPLPLSEVQLSNGELKQYAPWE